MVSPEKGWRGAQSIRCETVPHRVVRGCVLWDNRLGSDSSTVGSVISDAVEGDARRFLDGIHAHASTGL